jgi:hypothetical protein
MNLIKIKDLDDNQKKTIEAWKEQEGIKTNSGAVKSMITFCSKIFSIEQKKQKL